MVAQRLKRLPAMWETQLQSLGREEPLEKEMATHSSILAWRIPWTEELVEYSLWGHEKVGHNLATKQHQRIKIKIEWKLRRMSLHGMVMNLI